MNKYIRKLQLTGGSTLIVALPKEWVRKVGATKGQEVIFQELSDGSLRLVAGRVKGYGAAVDATELRGEALMRILIGLYLKGASRIVVKSEGRLEPAPRGVVKSFSRKVMGMEVVEEARDRIVLMDLSSPDSLPMEEGIGRMVEIARGMIADAADALEESDYDLAKDVIARDDDMDRIYWFLRRKATMTMRETCGTDPLEDILLIRTLERIGDHAARICHRCLETRDNVSAKLLENLRDSSFYLGETMDAFFRLDDTAANRLLDELKEKVNALRELSNFRNKLEYTAHDSTIRILLYTTDICELIIDRSSKKYIDK